LETFELIKGMGVPRQCTFTIKGSQNAFKKLDKSAQGVTFEVIFDDNLDYSQHSL
jgi:hypothetical protein